MPFDSLRKDVHAPPEACVEVLASVVRPEAVESKVLWYAGITSVSVHLSHLGRVIDSFVVILIFLGSVTIWPSSCYPVESAQYT